MVRKVFELILLNRYSRSWVWRVLGGVEVSKLWTNCFQPGSGCLVDGVVDALSELRNKLSGTFFRVAMDQIFPHSDQRIG